MRFFQQLRQAKLRDEIAELEYERDKLRRERDDLIDEHAGERRRLSDALQSERDKLAELKRQRKHEEEDIQHLVKMKESKLEIEYEKKTLELERKKETEIAAVKDEYRDKLEKQLHDQLSDMQKMYGEILARLPNVNVRLKGDVGA